MKKDEGEGEFPYLNRRLEKKHLNTMMGAEIQKKNDGKFVQTTYIELATSLICKRFLASKT